jgi:hypothetical protein
MGRSFIHFLAAGTIGVVLALSGAANAESVMKMCGDQWKAAKAAGTTAGQTWPQFLAQCRTQQPSGSAAAPAPTTYAPAPTPAPTTYAPEPASPTKTQSVMAVCGAQWKAAKAAGTTNGATWPQFFSQCRAQTANTAAPTTYAPAPAPATQPSIWPWQRPQAPQPSAAQPSRQPQPQVAARPAAPMSASEAQAQAMCPGALVVWVNTKSRIYHFPGHRDYGDTKQGAFMCETAALGEGDRAAMNEKHP